MVDFILFCFVLATFAAGWWCGKTYKTAGDAIDSFTKTVKGWFA